MYKAVFQNSKVALLFAGTTILSAVSMVGPDEDGSVLEKTVETLSEQRANVSGNADDGALTQGTVPETAASETSRSVFGDYVPGEAGSEDTSASEPEAYPDEPDRLAFR